MLGERFLRAYAAGGNVRFLQDALVSLRAVKQEDPNFDNARFCIGVTYGQLRQEQEALEILSELRDSVRARHGSAPFLYRIELQIAYFNIKLYTDEGFDQAEALLKKLQDEAVKRSGTEWLSQVKSLQAFLFSVKAGYSSDEAKRPLFANLAVSISQCLLYEPNSPEVRFEALNALGIASMRLADQKTRSKNATSDSMYQSEWAEAERAFQNALDIVPDSVRVLQNIGTMRTLQAKTTSGEDRDSLLHSAEESVKLSLDVNDQDQHPFFQLAEIALESKKPLKALEYVRIGRSRPGAVKPMEWIRLERSAMQMRPATP